VGNIGLIHFSRLSGINATNIFLKGNVGIRIGATGIETFARCLLYSYYFHRTEHRKEKVDKLCVMM
jgi:hypothetical protein